MRSRLGECLQQAGLIDDRDLRRAMAEHERSGDRLGAVLVRFGLLTEEQIADALASQLGFAYIDLARLPPDPRAVEIVPKELALRGTCIAVSVNGDELTVAMADPLLFSLVQELEARTHRRIHEVVATHGAIIAAIAASYPEATQARAPRPTSDAADQADESAASDAVDRILALAADDEATELHVEPSEAAVVVRSRLDGVLVPVASLPRGVHAEVVARLKLLAGLDVSEKLLPQAGRILVGGEAPVVWRLATLRTVAGEEIVLHAVDRRKPVRRLDELDMSPVALERLRNVMRDSNGLILVAGPRGSGKTATASALLHELKADRGSVASIAATVEYQIEGVSQVQLDEEVGLTAAVALRSAVVQDAGIVAVDEVRESDAAALAASGAGDRQLVVAVLEAEDAADAVCRMTGFAGTAAAAPALRAAIAQRLVRRLCGRCRRERAVSDADLRVLNVASADALSAPVFEPVGCTQCGFTGYRGRTGIFEVMVLTARLREMVAAGASAEELRRVAKSSGMTSLAEQGRATLERGVTSLDEVRDLLRAGSDVRPVCAQCGTAVSADFSACPHCGTPLGGPCPHCGRALQPGWNFCPFCARAAEQAGRSPRRGIIRLVRNPDSSDIV